MFDIAASSAGHLQRSGVIHLVDCWFSTIPATVSNNPPEKPPPHILVAGDKILRNLDIMQKVLNDLFNKNGPLKFDEDVPAIILQTIPTPQPTTKQRLHFTPPQLGGPHSPGLSQSTNLDTKEPFHQSHRNNLLCCCSAAAHPCAAVHHCCCATATAFLPLRRCHCCCRCVAAIATVPLPSALLPLPLCHCRKATATVTMLSRSSCRHCCAAATAAPLLPLLPPPCPAAAAPLPLPAAPILPLLLLLLLRHCRCTAVAAHCAAAAAAAANAAAPLCRWLLHRCCQCADASCLPLRSGALLPLCHSFAPCATAAAAYY